MRFILVLCLLALCLHCTACNALSYDARIDRTWSASAPSNHDLEVTTRNGSIEVIVDPARSATAGATATSGAAAAGPGGDVRIDAAIRTAGASQEEADRRLALVTIQTGERNGRLFIEPVLPDGWRSNDAVSLKVTVPAAANVTATTSNGAITVAQLSGSAELRTSNGSITATSVAGGVTARSSNGRIEIESVQGAVRADTSNGRVIVKGAPGPVDVDTSNGRMELIDVGGPINASTSNGGAEVVLRPGFAGTLEASTSNGRVTVDSTSSLRRSVMERSRATLEFSTPGPVSRVRTSNGSVEIKSAG